MSAQPLNSGEGGQPKPTAPAPISQLMGELVVDLLETTGLIPEAKFEALREGVAHLPVVQVLINEGLASSEAIARIVAAQHGLPVIELGTIGIDPEAANSVPLHVLEQVQAVDGRELAQRPQLDPLWIDPPGHPASLTRRAPGTSRVGRRTTGLT